MGFDADINARSLAGLPRIDGGVTTAGLWRSAAPDSLDAASWSAVTAAGIRRVVDLRNEAEREPAPHRPAQLEIVLAPLEDPADPDYERLWAGNWAIADFYLWCISRWPQLWTAALTAIAEAPEGGVLVHCAGGRAAAVTRPPSRRSGSPRSSRVTAPRSMRCWPPPPRCCGARG
jgi:hypothetical protein